MAGMIYGYARVSTDAQDLTSQLAQLKAAKCARIFRERVSGATADRPQLRKLLATVSHGGPPLSTGNDCAEFQMMVRP
jgi:DNA invertase Pin-like site-specific DNA recombinase